MPVRFSPSPALPAAWMTVLERIEQSLEQIIRLTIEREKELPTPPPGAPVTDPEALGRPFLQIWDERETRLQASSRGAEQTAAEADVVLAAGADRVNEWLSAAATVRGRLAEWTSRAV